MDIYADLFEAREKADEIKDAAKEEATKVEEASKKAAKA